MCTITRSAIRAVPVVGLALAAAACGGDASDDSADADQTDTSDENTSQADAPEGFP